MVKNNRLIGRGASDMKGSIAWFVAALSQFKKIKPKFKGSISLLITGDEEAKKIIEIMENAVTLEVPNKVDYEFGPNWGTLKEK